MFGSADLCVADRATRDAMHRAEQAGQAAEAAATAAVFLGGPPDAAASSYLGRIRFRHDPTDAWTRGELILPSGTPISWIAYSGGVARNLALFQSPGHVVVTGHHLAGDLYLTGIRPASTP